VALAIVANSNRGTSTSSFWLSPTIEWIGDIKIEKRERESKKLLSQNVPLSEEAIGRVENDKGCINVFIFFLLVSNTKPKINTAKVA
jgi:hypothetical protein